MIDKTLINLIKLMNSRIGDYAYVITDMITDDCYKAGLHKIEIKNGSTLTVFVNEKLPRKSEYCCVVISETITKEK